MSRLKRRKLEINKNYSPLTNRMIADAIYDGRRSRDISAEDVEIYLDCFIMENKILAKKIQAKKNMAKKISDTLEHYTEVATKKINEKPQEEELVKMGIQY